MSDAPKQYVALIGDARIPVPAEVVARYIKVYGAALPIRIIEVVDLPEVPDEHWAR